MTSVENRSCRCLEFDSMSIWTPVTVTSKAPGVVDRIVPDLFPSGVMCLVMIELGVVGVKEDTRVEGIFGSERLR